MLHIKLNHSIVLLLLLISVWSIPAYSEDCLVSTDARSLMSANSNLQSERLISKEGQYSAVLNNGDIVLAQFSTCDLGMSAHYFSVEKLNDSDLLKRVKMFLSQALASKAITKKVMPQLEGLSGKSFNQAIVFEGLGDQHQIIVKPSTSPVFKLHIQYNWIPPQF